MSVLKKFISNEDGNFAIMFSIGAAMLGAGVAVAIDIAGLTNARQTLQNNIDSAALSAVIEMTRNESRNNVSENSAAHRKEYEDTVIAILSASGINLQGTTPTITIDQAALTVQASVPYKFQFGGLINKKSTNIGVLTKIALPGNGTPVEIALVLDNTESMNFDGKMTALRQGSRDFIEAIEESNSGSKIALVPFARYVDVGEDKRSEPWLEVPAEFDTDRTWQQATHTGGTCVPTTGTRYKDGIEETYNTTECTGQTTTYETQHTVVESRWIGCVGLRSNERHLLDDSYNTEATRIQGLLHENPYEVTGFNWDEDSWCPHTITPLTDDYNLLDNEIDELYGTDRTHIPTGLIWGQRILSPKAPFTEADTVNPKRQIMILMSDGENTAYLQDDDEHEALPYVQDLNSQQQQDGVIPLGTNEDTATLCTSIKAEGIEMFTIAFKVDNAATENLLMNCASSPQHYFDAESNTLLVESFQNISKSLESEIRIMR